MAGKKSSKSIESAIFSRIKRWGRGCVVLPANFLDLGSRQAVGVALHRLEKAKSIRWLARGVYDYPIEDPLLGALSPTIEAITKALSERDRFKLQPSGAYALNMLGLSEQVPAKIVFLTDGESRTMRFSHNEDRNNDDSASPHNPSQYGSLGKVEWFDHSGLPVTGQAASYPGSN